MLNAGAGITGAYAFLVVNGVPLATPAFVTCVAGAQCAASGTWWLDIDAAESANPGLFLKQPLIIYLVGGNISAVGGGVGYEASFTAELIKNK